MDSLSISRQPNPLVGHLRLAGSKSISNRVLIIRALCGNSFAVDGLANATDTRTLAELLATDARTLDAGAAGTTFRFMTAFLAAQGRDRILTGSERMKQRPVGPLVEALRHMGADIQYLEKEGYPPLHFTSAANFGLSGEVTVNADTSSQYITALLLLAPILPNGLQLQLEGTIVSRPYIEMTLKLMQYFGVGHEWEGSRIVVGPQQYQPRPFVVEADWSAASYYYSMAALSEYVDLQLDGLFAESMQGDAVLSVMYEKFGVKTEYTASGIRLTKRAAATTVGLFEQDFLECPDLAQTVAVTCASLGIQGLFSGLETLRIKETDRIGALRQELQKFGTTFAALPARFSKRQDRQYYLLEGQAQSVGEIQVSTYDDHRMAMAFAPMAIQRSIVIQDPGVVTKSYPDFWKDLARLGFQLSPCDS
jgi:3-phosphoshikimate 1-carboxyvinyltransferase